jgi:WD40 repeat protein
MTVPTVSLKLPFNAAAISPDGTFAAVGSGNITVWSVADGQEVAALPGHTCWVHQLAFLSDGAGLASLGFDGTVLLWDLSYLR